MSLLFGKEIRVGLRNELMNRRRWLRGQVKRCLLRMMWNKRNTIIASSVIASICVVVKTATTALIVLIRLICLVFLFGVGLVVAKEIGCHGCWCGQWPSRMSVWNAVSCCCRSRIFVYGSSKTSGVCVTGRLNCLNVTVRISLHKHISIGWKHSRYGSDS